MAPGELVLGRRRRQVASPQTVLGAETAIHSLNTRFLRAAQPHTKARRVTWRSTSTRAAGASGGELLISLPTRASPCCKSFALVAGTSGTLISRSAPFALPIAHARLAPPGWPSRRGACSLAAGPFRSPRLAPFFERRD